MYMQPFSFELWSWSDLGFLCLRYGCGVMVAGSVIYLGCWFYGGERDRMHRPRNEAVVRRRP